MKKTHPAFVRPIPFRLALAALLLSANVVLPDAEAETSTNDKPFYLNANSKSEAKLAEAKDRIRALEKSLATVQGSEKSLRKVEEGLRHQLARAVTARDDVTKNFAAMESERDALQAQLDDTQKQWNATIAKAREESKQSEKQLKDQQSAAAREAEQLRSSARKLEEALRDQLAEAEVRRKAIEKENATASARASGFAKSLAESEQREQQLRRIEDDLRKQLVDAQRMRDELKAHCGSLEQERDEQKKLLADAAAQLERMQTDTAREATQLRTSARQAEEAWHAQLVEAGSRQKNLEKQHAGALSRLAGLEESLAKASDRIEEMERSLEERQDHIDRLRQESSDAGAQANSRIASLELQLARRDAGYAELEQTLAAQAKKFEEEGLIRQGRAMREQIDQPSDPALVWSLNDTGLIYLDEGRLDEAEEMFRRALVILDLTAGRETASAGTILQHLANTAWRKNNLVAAESLYREAAKSFAASVGPSHPRYAAALNGWAGVLGAQERLADAEKYYREALEIYSQQPRGLAADSAAPAHNLGLLLMNQGRLEEAGPYLERAAGLVERDGDRAGARGVIIMRTMLRYAQARGDIERAARYEKKVNDLAVAAMMP